MGLWLTNLHDGKRGPRQISQGASLLVRQRTLLECWCGIRFSRTRGSPRAIATTRTHDSAHEFPTTGIDGRRVRIAMSIFAM